MADTKSAKCDLEKAIELSGGKGRTGCQALCQRAQIFKYVINVMEWKTFFKSGVTRFLKLQSDQNASKSTNAKTYLIPFRKEGSNDKAKEDLQRAAELGSGWAKTALAQMNPYAAMCNAMLGNAFKALGASK